MSERDDVLKSAKRGEVRGGRKILHWIVIIAIIISIIVTVMAMIGSIPIFWGWIGPVGLTQAKHPPRQARTR